MRKLITLCVLCLSVFNLGLAASRSVPGRSQVASEPSEDMALLEDFIAATEQTLQASLKLKEKVTHYLQVQEKYLVDPSNRDVAYRMVKEARGIMDEIERHHLSQVFTNEFMGELSFFAQLGKKKGVPQL